MVGFCAAAGTANASSNSATLVRTLVIPPKSESDVVLISLEIPEPGATAYQNLIRQNPV